MTSPITPKDDELIEPCPKCGFQDQRKLTAEAHCHHASGGGEYVVICARCKHAGQLKARPEWAVQSWNEDAKPTGDDELVEFLTMLAEKLDTLFAAAFGKDPEPLAGPRLRQAASRIAELKAENESANEALRWIYVNSMKPDPLRPLSVSNAINKAFDEHRALSNPPSGEVS